LNPGRPRTVLVFELTELQLQHHDTALYCLEELMVVHLFKKVITEFMKFAH
jgi:hypothetical protein